MAEDAPGKGGGNGQDKQDAALSPNARSERERADGGRDAGIAPEIQPDEPLSAKAQITPPPRSANETWLQFAHRTIPWSAASVHLFTAIGSVIALLAMRAVLEEAWEEAFIWLGVALIIDAIDGPFARRVQVSERLPRWSGERLDLIIDYLTYVFVPVLMLLQAKFLTGVTGLTLASLILVSSLYHFSDTGSKSEDNYFVGFPAVWNGIVFYIFVFGLSELWASLVVILFVALTFVPLKWVHPVRVVWLRPLTLLLMGLWIIVAAWTLLSSGLPAAIWQQAVFAAVALYLVLLTIRHGVARR